MRIGIIGGGIAGLTAAALLSEAHDVVVYEGAREWGGSAGKFSRGEFTFAAGATLGMGFERDGIHERVLSHLGISLEADLLEEVMIIELDGQRITYHKDKGKFVKHLSGIFEAEKEGIVSFYEELDQIVSRIEPIMKSLPALPLRTSGDVKALLPHAIDGLMIGPYLMQTVKTLLVRHGLLGTTFERMVDGILLDSMQTGIEASALLGAIALTIYHRGAYYVPGGLFRIADSLKEKALENGAELQMGRQMTGIRRVPGGFLLSDRRGRFELVDELICAMPIEGVMKISDPSIERMLKKTYRRQQKLSQWATFTYYAAIPEHIVQDGALFRQVHDKTLPSGHAFISLSKTGDEYRAPTGYRTLTMSCHIEIGRFSKERKLYAVQEQEMQQVFERILEGQFPGFNQHALERLPGGPGAWVRYTFRPDGGVGGYPQFPGSSLFRAASFRTGLPGLSIIGDTIFPGAGTIGVTTSAIHVARMYGVDI